MKKHNLLGLLIIGMSLTSCFYNEWSSRLNSLDISENSFFSSESISVAEVQPKVGNGYLCPDSLTFYSKNYNPDYSPSIGNINILVIPLTLSSSNYNVSTWTNAKLNIINKNYFGNKNESASGWGSLKSYYSNASSGKVNISGSIAKAYAPGKSVEYYLERSWDEFYQMLTNAVNYTVSNNNFDWSLFDSDEDGYFDCVHFISNIVSTPNDDFFWPHMWFLGNEAGTTVEPKANVYMVDYMGSALSSATTAIHEQGHIFGLEDYYNYSIDFPCDYVGSMDMQSYNCFDWNSYSKLLTGWANPFVIDGSENSVTLKIRPSALTGDCILIPANYDTWNGTPYDEYILVEYFSKTGNNVSDWDYWENNLVSYYGSTGSTTLGNGGIRIYHVDSRLWGFNALESINNGNIVDPDTLNNYLYYSLYTTNSYNNVDYSACPDEAEGKALLSIVQACNQRTFSDVNNYRHFFSNSDFFLENDEFSMEKYGINFFPNQTTMNNGESFPYKIKIDSISSDFATITIEK